MKLIKTIHWAILALLFSLLLVSCKTTHQYYLYKGIRYDVPERAIEAQKNEIEAIINNIKITENPAGGSVAFIIPSKEYIKKKYTPTKRVDLSPEMIEKGSDFTTTIIYNSIMGRGNMIKKRQIFSNMIIVNSDDPENTPFTDNFAIKLYEKDFKQKWFLYKNMGNNTTQLFEIEDISESLPQALRINLWLEKIEAAAKAK